MSRLRRRARHPAAAAVLASLALAGCSRLGYYGQALWGGLEIAAKRRPIPALLRDPATEPELRERLRRALEVRDFASSELALPDGGSYRSYADLGRPYAVWNVVAAPELAVEPLEWCFPIAGCVTYRGYFSERRARRFAARLEERGHDVAVEGVAAYSTLGWLEDPVLSTFVALPDRDLAALIFHELAHQVVYLKDDTTFNESFATAVEEEGLRRWLAARGRGQEIAAYREARHRRGEVVGLILACRDRLAAVYAADRPAAWKRRRKGELLAALRDDYRVLRARGRGDPAYDPWFDGPLNNAHLASVGAYYELVAAFRALLAREGGELPRFYAGVARIARLAPAEREAALTGSRR